MAGKGSFASQFAYIMVRNNDAWFTTLPILKLEVTRSATNLAGNYAIEYPNPGGIALNLFNQFDTQEIWLAHAPTTTMYRAFVGQVNAIGFPANHRVKLEGRGLSGLLTDPKVSASWSGMRGDYILCDPTFGAIPLNLSNVSTWNAFTNDYDRFDYWDADRWGAQPAWAEISDGTVVLTGDAGSQRFLDAATETLYGVTEFYASVTPIPVAGAIYGGFGDANLSTYVFFRFEANGIYEAHNDGTGYHASLLSETIDMTELHYYRVEWDLNEARFFVDGVLLGTVTTNIPISAMKTGFYLENTDSVMTAEYVKLIQLTAKTDSYVSNDKILIDIVDDIAGTGNNIEDYVSFISDDWDFSVQLKESTASGYSFGYQSSTYVDADQQAISVEPSYEAKDLYNYIKIRGGKVLTLVEAPDWTDQFTGNAVQTTFTLGQNAQKPLTLLEVDGVAKTEGTDFTVTYGTEITVVQFATAPGNGLSINVRYNYFTPIIATYTNQASIDANHGIKRTYSESDDTITSQERASNLANALGAYYSDERTVIKVQIPLDPRLRIGTTVNIDAPTRGISVQAYEIIEVKHEVDVGKWNSSLTLVTTEINTSGEIIRDILKQIKNLRNRGETDAVTLDEYPLPETAELEETAETCSRDMNDSWVWGIAVWSQTKWGDRRSAPTEWVPA
ncbi:MAG: hypothetical protein M0R66_01355 [Candidatus Omnitrophica bacterium]|nr:hypothetical protein [Candidatus Omnitrophota bacterium]